MPPRKKYVAKNAPSTASKFVFTKYLVIVESPSKCKKIEEYLGSDYRCVATKGHLRTIDSLKSIQSKDKYQITFSVIKEKAAHIEMLRSIISQYSNDNIYLASDDDREGEAIAWHICDIFGLPIATTKRIIFHEITQPAIRAAVASPTTVNMSLVYSQHARQVLDILVGFTVSPFLWKHICFNKNNALSAGRCQTPALRLVYDNDIQWKTQEKNLLYKTTAYFFDQTIPFTLNGEFTEPDKLEDFLNKSKTFRHIIHFSSPRQTSKSPPKPFTTSKLLQTTSNLFHFSPRTTMDLCQQLYQLGHITYMRTDSMKYSPLFLEKTKEYIQNQSTLGEDYLGDFSKLTNADTANPHEAIRVTNLQMKSISSDNPAMCRLYYLIWKNTLASCMASATYNTTDVEITAPQYSYKRKIDVPIFLGWKKIMEKESLGDDGEDLGGNNELYTKYLLNVKNQIHHNMMSDAVAYKSIECNVQLMNRHSHYTEASLIQKLEDLGIGRPSTFASIVDTIMERGYVKKMDVAGEKIQCNEYRLDGMQSIKKTRVEKIFGEEKNKLVIQPTGILSLEFLLQHFESLFSYDYTKTMEEQLDSISSKLELDAGNTWYELCRNCHGEIKNLTKQIAKLEKQSYPLGEEGYSVVFHQYGASIVHTNEKGEKEYQNVKKDIQLDFEKLKRGEYSMEELLEIKNEHLGDWNNTPVLLKNGKFGVYLEWGEKKISLKTLKIPIDQITLNDVMPFLTSSPTAPVVGPNIVNKNVLRIISPEISIRKGRFGAYIYYQRADMKTPEFFSLKGFKEGFAVCNTEDLLEWIRETHKINVY